jgi:uroporphyrinogen-III synthase
MLVGGIGPVTTAALRREGLPVDVSPAGYGPENLARAVLFRFVFGQ